MRLKKKCLLLIHGPREAVPPQWLYLPRIKKRHKVRWVPSDTTTINNRDLKRAGAEGTRHERRKRKQEMQLTTQ
jgi:hypothetical protein